MKLPKSIKYTIIGAFVYAAVNIACVGSILGAQYASLRFTQRINSQAELEKILEREKRKLGLDALSIKAEFQEYTFCHSSRIRDGVYKIVLNNEICNTIGVLKHELYHIKKGHAGDPSIDIFNALIKKDLPRILYYIYRYETLPTLYSVTGLQL